MRIVTIIVIIILCLVAVQVIGVVVYLAAKRYYFHYIRQRMRFKRLEKLAMFIPAASAKIDRLKKQMKGSAQRQAHKLEVQKHRRQEPHRRRSSSFDLTVMKIEEPTEDETDQPNQQIEEQIPTRIRSRSL